MTTTDQTQPTAELDVDTANLVARLADLNAKIADLNTEAEAIKAELRSLTPGDYTHGGRPALRVVATRRFDPVKGFELVPEALRPNCYTQEIDAKKVKEYLAPALLEACMVESGKPRVTVL